MLDLENVAAIVASLRSYKQNVRQGRADLAQADADKAQAGIDALKGITGIQETRQRMMIEGAEERQRKALRPTELRAKEIGVEKGETELETMRIDLEQKQKTIDALEKMLAEQGMPTATPEALERGEIVEEILARLREEVPELKGKAVAREEEAKGLAAELAARISEERLEKPYAEKTVEAEMAAMETGKRRSMYEQTVLQHLEEQDVPLVEARTKALQAGQALDKADQEIKLLKRQSRRTKLEADKIAYDIGADEAMRKAYTDAGIDFNDMLVTRAKIEQGLWPKVNETLQNLEDGMRIHASIQARPAGVVDPLDIAMAEAMPRVAGLIKELLPKPEEKQAALTRMQEYINLQKGILSQSGMDYDSLVESSLVYTREDLQDVRSELGVQYTEAEGVSAKQITDYLDTVGLRMLNDADVTREQLLAGIQQNRSEGMNLDTLYGTENVSKFYSVLAALQGVDVP